MEFTPQQLAGSGCYNAKVRIGNWNEDLALSDVKARAAAHQRAAGGRLADRVKARTAAGARPAPLSACPDGLLRFGHFVNLRHADSDASLAANEHERVDGAPGTSDQFQVAGASARSLRSTFQVLPTAAHTDKEFVEIGDEVLLATHPGLRVDPHSGLAQTRLYLMSGAPSVMGSSGPSNKQEVRAARLFNARTTGDLRWRIEMPDVATSLGIADRRVRCFEPVMLVHCATGRALAMSASFKVYSDYGAELEAFCTLDKPARRVHVLKKEHSGLREPDHRVPVQGQNVWVFETYADQGQDQQAAESRDQAPTELAFQPVFDYLLYQASVDPDLVGRTRAELERADVAGDGMLDAVAFKFALVDAGVRLSADEMDTLLDGLAVEGTDISISAFIESLSGSLEALRE